MDIQNMNELEVCEAFEDSGKGFCTQCEHLADCPPCAGADYPYPVHPYAREDEELDCAHCGGVLVGVMIAYIRGSLSYCEGVHNDEDE
jgi:hypothetical protein